MKTIWKYELRYGLMSYELPKGAVPLHVHNQNETPTLWAEVDTEELETEKRLFEIVSTGGMGPDIGQYIGTLHQPPYVWHVYEVVEER